MTASTPSTAATLLVVGNDHFGKALALLTTDLPYLRLARDRSVTVTRVVKLLRRGSVKPSAVLRQGWTAIRQRLKPDQRQWPGNMIDISSNAELLHLAEQYAIKRLLLFRAGLIINQAVLDSGIEVLNIHCAKLPVYGGLGAIERALSDGALDQCATLHRVTKSIDSGEIVMENAYKLDPTDSMANNEKTAYNAGIALGLEFLSRDTGGK